MSTVKQINANIPDTGAFLLAFPSPKENLMEIGENRREFVICGENGDRTPVVRLDFLRYKLDFLSDIICQLTYGQDSEWVRKHLMEKYPDLTDESYIAFFLFKKKDTNCTNPTHTPDSNELHELQGGNQ